MSDVLAWTHDTAEVGGAGLSVTRSATADELVEIARALDILACGRLEAAYRLRAIAGGGYRLAGNLVADVVQACVVSLEPVPGHLEVPFEVEYWPDADRRAATGTEEIAALSALEIEPLSAGRIDAGRIVFEQLAAALDPYPRKAGAVFTPPAADVEDAGRPDNPFAVLKRLKDPS